MSFWANTANRGPCSWVLWLADWTQQQLQVVEVHVQSTHHANTDIGYSIEKGISSFQSPATPLLTLTCQLQLGRVTVHLIRSRRAENVHQAWNERTKTDGVLLSSLSAVICSFICPVHFLKECNYFPVLSAICHVILCTIPMQWQVVNAPKFCVCVQYLAVIFACL